MSDKKYGELKCVMCGFAALAGKDSYFKHVKEKHTAPVVKVVVNIERTTSRTSAQIVSEVEKKIGSAVFGYEGTSDISVKEITAHPSNCRCMDVCFNAQLDKIIVGESVTWRD